MQDKDTTKSTLNQFLEELSDQELLKQLCKELGVDKYVKKLTLDKLLALVVLAHGSFAATFAVQTLKCLVERHYKTYFFAF